MTDWVGLEVELSWEFDGVPRGEHGTVIAQDNYVGLYEVKFPQHAPLWLRPGFLRLG